MRLAVIFVGLSMIAACSDGGSTLPDAARADARAIDAEEPEAGEPDATGADAERADANEVDAGEFDAGAIDADALDADSVDAGELDADSADAGELDAGAPDALDPDAGDAGPPCVPETDAQLCRLHGADCDSITATDRCGTTRTAGCGTCNAPQSCGAHFPNLCGVEHWAITTIDATGDAGREVSMTFGLDGYPRVAYQATFPGDSDLRYAEYDGTSWAITTIDAGPSAGMHTAIAADPLGGLHLAATSLEGLILWTLGSAGWTRDLVTAGARGRLDLTFDPLGVPHICIYNESLADLEHWYRGPGGWILEAIEGDPAPAARQGDYCSIASDSAGNLWVSYYDEQFQRLKYAFKTSGGAWITGEVDAPGGTYTAIAVDSTDTPSISYRGGTAAVPEIRLATLGTPWSARAVDANAGSTANYTNLSFDPGDFPTVTYYDSTGAGTIKYAIDSLGGWFYETIETVGTNDAGHNASALDAADLTHLFFYNSLTQSLRYARYVP